MIAPSPVRQGLDLLLSHYPGFDLLTIEWDEEPHPWVLVTLGQPGESLIVGEPVAYARHHFAIWKTTGAVHGLGHFGAVSDDPLFVPEVR